MKFAMLFRLGPLVVAAVALSVLLSPARVIRAATGPYLVKDIRADNAASPGELAKVAGTVFFVASDGVHGHELWKSDGTRGGTVLVQDIHPTQDSRPRNMTKVRGTLFFSSNDGVRASELWAYKP